MSPLPETPERPLADRDRNGGNSRPPNTTARAAEALGAKEAATVRRPYTGDNGHLEAVAPAGRSQANAVLSQRDWQAEVYAWLGYYRDRLPDDAVASLQRLLGPLSSSPSSPK